MTPGVNKDVSVDVSAVDAYTRGIGGGRMKPQAFLRTLDEHWSLVGAIWDKFESRAFAEADLFRLCLSFYDQALAHGVIRKLTLVGVLVEFKRGGSGYQFNTQVTPFIQFLLNEQNLGLLGEISLNANQLLVHLTKIEEALREGRRTEYFDQCGEMQSRFSGLSRMCEQNRQAIFRLADQAKQADIAIPLSQRYAKVLSAWDEYITPALNMRAPGDPFDQVMRRIMREIQNWLLDDGIHLLSHDDARYELEVIQYRLLDFKEVLERSVNDMALHLSPLVRHVRVNTHTARGAALCFRALAQYNGKLPDEHDLRLPAKKRYLRKPNEDSLSVFYAEFMNIEVRQPADRLETEHSLDAVSERKRRANVPQMVKWLHQNRPVADMVSALQSVFPEAEAVALLTAINHLILNEGTRRKVVRHADQQCYHFDDHDIRMNRRSFETKTAPARVPPLAELLQPVLEPTQGKRHAG